MEVVRLVLQHYWLRSQYEHLLYLRLHPRYVPFKVHSVFELSKYIVAVDLWMDILHSAWYRALLRHSSTLRTLAYCTTIFVLIWTVDFCYGLAFLRTVYVASRYCPRNWPTIVQVVALFVAWMVLVGSLSACAYHANLVKLHSMSTMFLAMGLSLSMVLPTLQAVLVVMLETTSTRYPVHTPVAA